MSVYRIYMLDGAGRVLTGSDATCANDEAARTWASTTLGGDAQAEIWEADRCVGRISDLSELPQHTATRSVPARKFDTHFTIRKTQPDTGLWHRMINEWRSTEYVRGNLGGRPDAAVESFDLVP
jgi:hypothetical protein